MYDYHDEWIKENYLACESWKALWADHNRIFGTDITYVAWKDHCTKRLGLHKIQFHYTQEMMEWLKTHYPDEGISCFPKFNQHFGLNKSDRTLYVKCESLGLRISDKRERERVAIATSNCMKLVENHKNMYKVGDISYRMLGGGGYVAIKTENGWKSYAKYLFEQHYGKIPEGYTVTFLDGDKHNFDIDNLCLINKKHQSQVNNLCRSGNKHIRKLSIQYCELNEIIENEVV